MYSEAKFVLKSHFMNLVGILLNVLRLQIQHLLRLKYSYNLHISPCFVNTGKEPRKRSLIGLNPSCKNLNCNKWILYKTYILCKYLHNSRFFARSVILKGKCHTLFFYIIPLYVLPLELYHLRLKNKIDHVISKQCVKGTFLHLVIKWFSTIRVI